jgi:hypothetical protein
VQEQPAEPRQICTVAKGSGVTSDADFTDIEISCVDQ